MKTNKDIAIEENIAKPHTIETFYKNINMSGDCHIWLGQIDHRGYGEFGVYSKNLGKKVSIKAHRFAYSLKYGFDKLPKGVTSNPEFVINHMCHNPACVNPGHLEVITNKENSSKEKRKPKDGAA